MFLFCLVFAMSLCVSVYMCFVVTCTERADLLALVCGVYYEFVTFPLVSHQVWYLIVSIPDLCTLTYSEFIVPTPSITKCKRSIADRVLNLTLTFDYHEPKMNTFH